jgi:hypothetical protein
MTSTHVHSGQQVVLVELIPLALELMNCRICTIIAHFLCLVGQVRLFKGKYAAEAKLVTPIRVFAITNLLLHVRTELLKLSSVHGSKLVAQVHLVHL